MKGAIAVLVLLVAAACAKPAPERPVHTSAEALAVARRALGPEEAGAELAVKRQGNDWIVSTPQKAFGTGSGQTAVVIDARTGRATTSHYQTAVIDEAL